MVITWQQLRDAREYADLTQSELAERLDVSVRTIVNWESETGGGVPQKREYRVERILGKAIQIVDHLQSVPIPDNSDGPPPIEWIGYQEREAPTLESDGIADVTTNARNRRRAAMGVFTDTDLLDELRDRADGRGIAGSDWSAKGMERLYSLGNVRPNLQTIDLDEEKYAADANNERPDEDLRQP